MAKAKKQKAIVTLVVTAVDAPGVKIKKKDLKEIIEAELRGARTDLIEQVKVRAVDID